MKSKFILFSSWLLKSPGIRRRSMEVISRILLVLVVACF